MKIELTTIYVDDQDKALRFYTDVLGFQKKDDVKNEYFRWLTVVSPEDPDGRVEMIGKTLLLKVGMKGKYAGVVGLYPGPKFRFETVELDRFRFGPAEWLWRSLTYGRRQPMRRAPADAANSTLTSGKAEY